jgi:methionine sulfoxide reductase heme-binding subunit
MIATSAPVWYLMRASGVTSLVLLTGVMALGIATWGGVVIGSLPRFATMALHRSISLMAVAFVAVHVVTAVVDPYAAVRAIDVVVPFSARSHALLVGLGAVAVDLLLALVVTGLLRLRLGRRGFRAVHWAAYLAWPVAFLHAVGIGSDTGTTWLRSVAVACVAAVCVAAAWRLAAATRDPEREATAG